MRDFVAAIGALRAPFISTLLGIFIVVLPQQSIEVFSSLREASGLVFTLEWLRFFVLLVIFILVNIFCFLRLLTNLPENRADAVRRHRIFLESLALAAPFAIILALLAANIDVVWLDKAFPLFQDGGSLSRVITWPRLIGFAALAQWMLVVVLLVRKDEFRSNVLRALEKALKVTRVTPLQGVTGVTTGIGSVIVLVSIFPHAFSSVMGPIGIFFIFLSFLTLITSIMSRIYDLYGIPVISLLIIAAAVWGFFPINNNHQIRLAADSGETMDVTSAFKEWLRKRSSSHRITPYPVYIVTAEGGGLYAAAHTAWTLARIQDRCPGFARHVFAISAVSGGSLGASVFSALLKADATLPNDQGEECAPSGASTTAFQDRVKIFFNRDFLTPLLASALFPDFFQRFLPWRVDSFDRARALEDGFSEAWQNSLPKESGSELQRLFHKSLSQLWSSQGNQPALLLNATLVHNGERVVMAPFRLWNPGVRAFADRYIDLLNGDYRPGLATAVGISARFPFITPPALHWHADWQLAAQLVDGGYYENSGVLTAINLIDLIRRSTNSHDPAFLARALTEQSCGPNNIVKVSKEENSLLPPGDSQEDLLACIKIITIRSITPTQKDSVGGDFLSVFPAMLQARVARGIGNLALSYALYCGGANCGRGKSAWRPHVYVKYLDTEKLRLPLGWYLTDKTLAKIWVEDEPDLKCENREKMRPIDALFIPDNQAIDEENNCLYYRISTDILEKGKS